MDEIAEITGGRLRGTREHGVRVWKGIEYAQAERFGLPQAVEPWSGERDAIDYAPQVPQGMGKRFIYDKPGYTERGSLALNVWAPDAPGPHPVFVWIHGGAFVAGGSNMYSGWKFARDHGLVFVGLNYRLGALGFGAFGDALGIPDVASNLGLRDQIAALEWVRDNIGTFGGDPSKVTIAGESAGSMSVSLLMIAPSARGLFHGAILQSGALNLIQDRETAHRLARRYAEILELDQSSAEKLRTMPLKNFFAAQQTIGEEEKGSLPAAPFWDGDVLPASLEQAQIAETAPVPIIAGANAEETRLFEWIGKGILPLERDHIEAILHRQLGAEDAREVLAVYPRTTRGNRALATDLAFAMPTRHFAEDHATRGHPTWAYRFDWENWLVGAAHAMDLLYLFPMRGTLATLIRGGPLKGGKRRLAETMQSHWAHFTRHGRPGDEWPAYTPQERFVMLFDTDSRVEENPDAARFAVWSGRIVAPRSR